MHRWLDASLAQRQADITRLFAGPWPPERDYIDLVKAPADWGVFASTGQHFQYALFGRDAIETAEDLLATHRQLVHDIILALCKLQGTKTDAVSEEEPGKIHHEHRALHLDGFTIPDHSRQILHDLQNVWGGADTGAMTYYGAHDTTPLFVRLVNTFVQTYGTDILQARVTRKNGQIVTVRGCIHAALEWLVGKIAAHPLDLFAYRRLNPDGLVNQDWKDSYTSHLHTDGSLPNPDAGIASIEMQGLAYDALLAGGQLNAGTPDERARWAECARRLQQQTVSQLWQDDEQYFAQGLEIAVNSRPRLIATITSDPAALLDSQLIHDLPADQAAHFVQSIARMVFSPELLTSIGVRCRAVRHWDLLDFIDYHGPNTVWPKETFDIAKGLRRAGLHHLAKDLEHRLASGLQRAGEFYEFFYVSRDDTVWYDRDKALAHFKAESAGRELPSPEPGQAWTIAAAIRIAYEQPTPAVTDTPPPTDFEQSLLSNLR
jgi:glycogen debranching enzyme